MGQIFSRVRPTAILNVILIIGGLIGLTFFLKNWDRPITDATIFSAILVEVPIQVLIKRYGNT